MQKYILGVVVIIIIVLARAFFTIQVFFSNASEFLRAAYNLLPLKRILRHFELSICDPGSDDLLTKPIEKVKTRGRLKGKRLQK